MRVDVEIFESAKKTLGIHARRFETATAKKTFWSKYGHLDSKFNRLRKVKTTNLVGLGSYGLAVVK